MPNEVARLPVPDHLEPKNTAHSLAINVRNYFYSLYNDRENATFREHLVSVGNKDSITGNRLFDRHMAVGMIKTAAKQAKDNLTMTAKDGDIYKNLVHILGNVGLGLKQRRHDYKRLTHQVPAE